MDRSRELFFRAEIIGCMNHSRDRSSSETKNQKTSTYSMFFYFAVEKRKPNCEIDYTNWLARFI